MRGGTFRTEALYVFGRGGVGRTVGGGGLGGGGAVRQLLVGFPLAWDHLLTTARGVASSMALGVLRAFVFSYSVGFACVF